MFQFDRVYPQGAVPPITTALRQDLLTSGDLTRSPLDTSQRFAVIGDTIPIVFCQRIGSIGGVFVSPAAVRFRVSNLNATTTTYVGTVLSEGCVPTVPSADVFIGPNAGKASSVQTVCNGIANGYTGNSTVAGYTYKETEVYAAGNTSSGVPATRTNPGSVITEGGGVIEVKSKSNDCTSFTASILYRDSSYQMRGSGNGLDGYPQYIVGKNWGRTTTNPEGDADDSRSYPIISARKYTYVTQNIAASIIWSQTTTKVSNPDKIGRAEYAVRFHSPYRTASRLYPPSVAFGGNGSSADINQWLDHAKSSAFSSVHGVDNQCYTADREERYVGSGTSLEVIQDNFVVEVTEVTEHDYEKPEGYPLFGGSGGTFSGLTTLSATYLTNTADKHYLRQVHAFVRNGMQVTRLTDGVYGSSSLFPDLAHWCMTVTSLVPSSMIDTARLRSAAQFTQAQALYFNGVIANAVNLREFLDRVAPFFLLRVSHVDGKYGLQPVLPTNGSNLETGPVTPVFEFTEAYILTDSFTCASVNAADLRPFCALMLWRSQPTTGTGTVKTVEVRYANSALGGPFEQYDMTDFCTSEAHAAKTGRYIISRRRRVTHTASWNTTLAASAINPGDVVRVTLSTADSLTGRNSVYSELYQVERITEETEGIVSIEASFFPVDSTGRSLVALDIANGI